MKRIMGKISRFLHDLHETKRHIETSRNRKWCRKRDSNPRPTHYECAALPTELLRPVNGEAGVRGRSQERRNETSDTRKPP